MQDGITPLLLYKLPMTKEGFFKTFDISLSDAEVDFSEKKEVSIVQVVRTGNVKIIFGVFLELVEKVQYLQKAF